MKDGKHIINNYYYGRYDLRNFAIYERKLSGKDGKERFEAIGFYPNIKDLIRGIKRIYANQNLLNKEVEELINELQMIEEEING